LFLGGGILSFLSVSGRQRFLLLGLVAVSSLSISEGAQAAQVCPGIPTFLGGAVDGNIIVGADCTVAAADQPVTPSVDATVPSPTTTQKLVVGTALNEIVVEQGAGIVNIGNGVLGHAILSGSLGGSSVGTITNDGFLATDSNMASTVTISQPSALVINNGTAVGSTSQTAVIATHDQLVPVGSSAIFAGGFVGQPRQTGDITINQGSANSAGSIIHHGTQFGPAIFIANTSGDVSINNFQGEIVGPSPVAIDTAGSISIVNGIDTSAVGVIRGTKDNIAAIAAGTGIFGVNTPSSMSVVNNAGSTISAHGGATGSAFFLGEIGSGIGATTIVNHGIISTPGDVGFALLRPIGIAGGGVTLTNHGMITGEIIQNSPLDRLVMQGGIINGTILAPDGTGHVEVAADSRLNGALASSNGGVIGDRSSIDLALNFGELKFVSDAALSVGHDPRNAVLNNNVFFSQLSADIRTTQDETGTINYLFGTNIRQSVGTSDLALKGLNFLSGTSTIQTPNNAFHVMQTTIGSGARVELLSDQTISGNVKVNGELDLNVHKLDVIASEQSVVDVISGATLTTQIAADGPTSGSPIAGTNGQIEFFGNTVLRDGAQIVVEIAPGVDVSTGARFALATATQNSAGSSDAVVGDVSISSQGGISWGVFNASSFIFGDGVGNSSDIYLIANAAQAATAALQGSGAVGGNDELVSTLVEFASPTGQATGQTLFAELLSIPTAAAIETALTQLTPDVSGGASQGASAAQGAATSTVGGRADTVQAALSSGNTGVAAGGNSTQEIGVWGQAYGFNALQDKRRGTQGFSAFGGGFVVGVDTEIAADTVLGAALSYGQTRVEGRGTLSENRTDVDSYQASLYSVYQGDPWFVQSQVGYAFQQFDTRRVVNVGALRETPTAEFEGQVFSAGVSAGYPLSLGDYVVTPTASLDYVNSQQDAYTETGAPTTALSLNENRDESLKTGLVVGLASTYELGEEGKLTPELRLGWFHEMKADAPNSVAQFAFGSSPFSSQGATPARDSLNVGLHATFVDAGGFSGAVKYDAEIKDRYLSNTLSIRARWSF
jgi:outer membrane autotransporter protein